MVRNEMDSLDSSISKTNEIKGGDRNIEIDKVEVEDVSSEKIELDNMSSIEKEIETDEIETDDNKIEVDDGLDNQSVDNEKTEAERIEENSEYSSEVNSYMRSEAELGIYQKAGLEEQEIGEKKALIRNDIDWDKVDEKGRTNSERIQRGLAPLDSDGDSIELHHVGQKVDSPLAELTFEEHRGKGNDTILHDKTIQSEAHAEGTNWDTERQDYWVSRAAYNKEVAENE